MMIMIIIIIIISLNLKLFYKYLFIFKYKSRARKKEEYKLIILKLRTKKSNPTSVTKHLRLYLYNPEQQVKTEQLSQSVSFVFISGTCTDVTTFKIVEREYRITFSLFMQTNVHTSSKSNS